MRELQQHEDIARHQLGSAAKVEMLALVQAPNAEPHPDGGDGMRREQQHEHARIQRHAVLHVQREMRDATCVFWWHVQGAGIVARGAPETRMSAHDVGRKRKAPPAMVDVVETDTDTKATDEDIAMDTATTAVDKAIDETVEDAMSHIDSDLASLARHIQAGTARSSLRQMIARMRQTLQFDAASYEACVPILPRVKRTRRE